ncbi:MAG: hypothetical protein ACYC3S_17260 [Chloroflexota bacterium]
MAGGDIELLPVFPLDGGWILRALVWQVSGDRWRATEVAINTARLAGYVAVLAGALVMVRGALLTGAWLLAAGLLAAAGASAERERQLDQTATPEETRPSHGPGALTRF